MFDFLTAIFHGPTAHRFTAVEQQVLDSLFAILPEPYQDFAREQIRLVSLIQRFSNGKEVNMYRKRGFSRVQIPPNLELPKPQKVYRLARVSLKSEQGDLKIHADVHVVDGHIFSIEFNKSPKDSGTSFSITESRLIADFSKVTFEDAELDAPLPRDYLDLVGAGDLFVNGWHILDRHEIRQVILPEHNYYLLAEKEEVGYIGARCSDQSGTLVFFDGDDLGHAELIESSFVTFVNSYVHK